MAEDTQGQAGFFDEEITGDRNLNNAITTWEAERATTEPIKKRFTDANTRYQAQLGVEREAEKVVTDLVVRRHARDVLKAKNVDDVPHRYRCDGWVFEVTDEVDVKVAPFTEPAPVANASAPPPAKTPRRVAEAADGGKDALEGPARSKPRKAAKRKASKAAPKPRKAKPKSKRPRKAAKA